MSLMKNSPNFSVPSFADVNENLMLLSFSLNDVKLLKVRVYPRLKNRCNVEMVKGPKKIE